MTDQTHFNSRLGYFFLGLLTSLVGAALVFVLAYGRLALRTHALPDRERTGPWGTISAVEVPLANPDGILPDEVVRMQKPSWYFENFTEARLVQLLRTCDLRPVQRSILFDKHIWVVTSNACILTPPEPVIWSLNSRARAIIYSALANCPSNYAQCYPFRFMPERFEEQLQESGLAAPEIQKIKRLAYTNAGAVCFTDLKAIHEVLKPKDFEDLVTALYKVPAYALRLVIPPESNVDRLIQYWGRGGREKTISPLLKGLARVPGGAGINIAQLLPPFARARLYTYPDAWDDPNAPREDCFFTAMNFFAETPSTNFFDREYTTRILAEDFDIVEGEPTYGDRLMLLNAKNEGVHICVHIAGDFVFTKNGINRAEPWVLMRMSDVLGIYFGSSKAGRLVIFRPKEKPAAPGV